MIRLCVRSVSLQAQLNSLRQLTSQLKASTACNHILTRNYAIKVTDDTDSKLETIYYGPLTPQIKGVKVFSLSSSIAGLIAQPIIIREAANIGSTSLLVALCSVVGFFTFVTPILLHIITKKYVTEINYNPETSTYKATTITFFLARKKVCLNKIQAHFWSYKPAHKPKLNYLKPRNLN